jgi:hypothetical protein
MKACECLEIRNRQRHNTSMHDASTSKALHCPRWMALIEAKLQPNIHLQLGIVTSEEANKLITKSP